MSCTAGFLPLVNTKFRKILQPSINEKLHGPRQKSLRASGNLTIGLSGGLGSTVLLDLVAKNYFMRSGPDDNKGGKDHPRRLNEKVWNSASVCYVEISSAFPGMRDSTADIRAIVESYNVFEFVPLKLEDAFDPSWWDRVGGVPLESDLGFKPGGDNTQEDLLLCDIPTSTFSTPLDRLRAYLSAMPTQTALLSSVQALIRLLLLYSARSTQSSHLLLGTSLTSLSINLISGIAQGGGFSVREEVDEEWHASAGKTIRVVRPLRDLIMKECIAWAWWNNLTVVGETQIPGAKQGIGSLTKDSTGGLVAASTNGDLPLFHPQRRDTPSTRSKPPRRGIRRHLLGWKLLVLGSWLNVLLLFLPVAWVIGWAVPEWASVVFACCILGLIPLVKLHELTTMELSLRLGSSRTGLINATMGNLVEIVVAFSALRRCELKVVQSALLVLGMCFFAGGLRFSEQDFDSTATGINSSLLSISVGAVILPTAYHFSLHAGSEASPDERRGILKMSHGVSIILLFIYLSYLLFQLWSHTHLYNNGALSKTQRSPRLPNGPAMVLKQRSPGGTWRRRFSSGMDSIRAFEKLKSSEDITTATLSLKMRQREDTLVEKPSKMYSAPMMSRSETTLAGSSALDLNEKMCSSEGVGKPTVRLVNERGSIKDVRGAGSLDSIDSSASEEAEWRPRILSPVAEVTSREERSQVTQEDEQCEEEESVPRLSVFLTIVTLVVVTILVVVTADSLVETLDEISKSVSKQWIGLILLPAVTSVAEMVTAVNVSVKDQLAFSINLAVGSTIQTALFVIPLMVCVGWAMEKPMSLLFDPFESVVLYIAVQTMSYVVADGKSNWLEGMILICLYMTIGVAFWYYPGANLPISLTTC
ncbi:hypothetical protein EYR36_008843 [Pleurotus pulmonarius]|nr:hypothetical protein EYR36_008843 [Pleurotus pulmonarius]